MAHPPVHVGTSPEKSRLSTGEGEEEESEEEGEASRSYDEGSSLSQGHISKVKEHEEEEEENEGVRANSLYTFPPPPLLPPCSLSQVTGCLEEDPDAIRPLENLNSKAPKTTQEQEPHSRHGLSREEVNNLRARPSSSYPRSSSSSFAHEPPSHRDSSSFFSLKRNNQEVPIHQDERGLSLSCAREEKEPKKEAPHPSSLVVAESSSPHPTLPPPTSGGVGCMYTPNNAPLVLAGGERAYDYPKNSQESEAFFPPSFSLREAKTYHQMLRSEQTETKYWRLSIDVLSIQFFSLKSTHPHDNASLPSSQLRRQVYVQYNYPPFGASHLFSTQPPVDCSARDDQVNKTRGRSETERAGREEEED